MISERILIEQCAPTLSGLKTANLFTVRFDNLDKLNEDIVTWNQKFKNNGIKIMLLKLHTDSALIYLYREDLLKQDFKNNIAKAILEKYGYVTQDVSGILKKLQYRLSVYDEFPHEIGLFLGYPPEDVSGFICHKGKGCNLCGYWKVYGNTEEALQIFARYDKCKAVYKKLWENGRDILQLTVKKQLVA